MAILSYALFALLAVGAETQPSSSDRAVDTWSLSEAVQILNSSPWARQETFTTVVAGIGSGLSGEKEIYNRFYVRFLSARPVLEAYTRVLQIDYRYDEMTPDKKRSFDEILRPLMRLDSENWIVVTVSFRSNDPDRESLVRRFLLQQTTATLLNKAFLSTDRLSQVKIHAYYPPLDEGMGARFVFPRVADGVDLLSEATGQVSFELLDIPIQQGGSTRSGGGPVGSGSSRSSSSNDTPTILRATFSLGEMARDDAKIAAGTQRPADAPPDELNRIGAFAIPYRELDAAFSRRGSIPFPETVNAFSARNRGRFYGSVYEYHRNDYFDARNFFDPVGEKLPEYKRNQFGGSLGVLVTERLQLFGTYDGTRLIKGSTITSLVPAPEMRSGDFSSLDTPLLDPFTNQAFPGSRISGERLSPVAQKMLSMLPLPNRSDIYPYFTNSQPRVQNGDTITGRVDYQLSKDSKVFGNYRHSDSYTLNVSDMPAFANDQYRVSHDFSVTYNRAFNRSLVTNIRLEYSREAGREFSKFAYQKGLLASLGIKGVSVNDPSEEGYPTFNIAGYPVLGQASMNPSPRLQTDNDVALTSDLTYVVRNHNLKFGFQISNNQINNYLMSGNRRGVFTFDGQFTGNAFADFLMGIPAEATRLMGSDRQDLRQRTWQAYLKDDWKINRRFSLSLGLTYDYSPLGHSIRDDVSLFWPLLFEPPNGGYERLLTTGSPAADAAGLQGIKPGHVGYDDKNDWAPSVGLAYSPNGSNKLVIRAAYGWHYNSPQVRFLRSYIGRNYPYRWDETASSPDAPTLTLVDPFRASVPAELRIQAVDPRIRSSYVQTWRLSIQNEFMPGWSVELGYEGRKATRMGRTLAANVPAPGEGLIKTRRPNPQFGRFDIYGSGGSSSGNQGLVSLTKRLRNGFSIRSDFNWDRTFSDVPGYREFASNPRNLRAERSISGGSPMDFSLNYIWDLPIGRDRTLGVDWAGRLRFLLEGWQVSGITTISSGSPFTPKMSGDYNNDGVAADRPDRIGSGVLEAGRSVDSWFNTADFVAPAEYAFGNSGRYVLRAPGQHTWDISFLKRTRVSERGDVVELRVQFFNALNHPNFQAPGATVGADSFGRITNAREAREVEIALKYTF